MSDGKNACACKGGVTLIFPCSGVATTPALVVNGYVKVTGRVPTLEEMKKILSSSL